MRGYDTGYTHGFVSRNLNRFEKAVKKENLYSLKCNVCGVPVVDLMSTEEPHIVKLEKRECWGDSAAGYQFCKEHAEQAEEERIQRKLRGY